MLHVRREEGVHGQEPRVMRVEERVRVEEVVVDARLLRLLLRAARELGRVEDVLHAELERPARRLHAHGDRGDRGRGGRPDGRRRPLLRRSRPGRAGRERNLHRVRLGHCRAARFHSAQIDWNCHVHPVRVRRMVRFTQTVYNSAGALETNERAESRAVARYLKGAGRRRARSAHSVSSHWRVALAAGRATRESAPHERAIDGIPPANEAWRMIIKRHAPLELGARVRGRTLPGRADYAKRSSPRDS